MAVDVKVNGTLEVALATFEDEYGLGWPEFFELYRDGKLDELQAKVNKPLPESELVTWVGLCSIAITSGSERLPAVAR